MIHQFQIKMDGYNTVFSIAFDGRTCDWNFWIENFPTKIVPTYDFSKWTFQLVRRLMRYLHFLAHWTRWRSLTMYTNF